MSARRILAAGLRDRQLARIYIRDFVNMCIDRSVHRARRWLQDNAQRAE